MPKGGFRRGAGRPKGAKNKHKKERLDPVKLAEECGRTPLRYLLDLMEDETAEPARRDWAADRAAMYMHPRLAIVQTQTTPRTINHDVRVVLVRPEGHDKPMDVDMPLAIGPPP